MKICIRTALDAVIKYHQKNSGKHQLSTSMIVQSKERNYVPSLVFVNIEQMMVVTKMVSVIFKWRNNSLRRKMK